jgi:hypothetical protein
MPSRFCASCGRALPCLNRSKTCRQCKEQIKRDLKEKAKHEQIDALHEAGFVLLHSCIGPADPFLESCSCRQKLTLAQAREKADKGEILDLEKRAAYFFGKGKDVLTSSKRKQVPRTSTIDRTQIQRGTQDIKWQKKARQVYRSPEEIDTDRQAEYRDLQAKIQEDNFQRSEEEKYRWMIWQDLSKEFYQSLIRIVPPDEYEALKLSQVNVPVLQGSPIGQDERTLGGTGRDCGPQQVFEGEENESTDVEDQEAGEASEPEEDNPSDQAIDPDFLENDDEKIEEDFVGITPADEEMTTWQPES